MQLATKLLKLRLVQFGTGVNGDWKDDDLIIDSKCFFHLSYWSVNPLLLQLTQKF